MRNGACPPLEDSISDAPGPFAPALLHHLAVKKKKVSDLLSLNIYFVAGNLPPSTPHHGMRGNDARAIVMSAPSKSTGILSAHLKSTTRDLVRYRNNISKGGVTKLPIFSNA